MYNTPKVNLTSKSVIKKNVLFHNGNNAIALLPSPEQDIGQIIEALGLSIYKTVIVSVGGADNMDPSLVADLSMLFEHIAQTAAKVNAVIIDGGTESGVMKMIGKAVAAGGNRCELIGVAPFNKISLPGEDNLRNIPLDPNHSHFLLVQGDDWGSESETLYKLAKALSDEIPGITILTGGGEVAKGEMLLAVRLSHYIIIIQGSGGIADEIYAAWNNKQALVHDRVTKEIITDGNLHFCPLRSSAMAIEKALYMATEG